MSNAVSSTKISERFLQDLTGSSAPEKSKEFIDKYKSNKIYTGIWAFFGSGGFDSAPNFLLGALGGSSQFFESKAHQHIVENFSKNDAESGQNARNTIESYKNLSLLEVLSESGMLTIGSLVASSTLGLPLIAAAGISVAVLSGILKTISRLSRYNTLKTLVENKDETAVQASKNFIGNNLNSKLPVITSGFEKVFGYLGGGMGVVLGSVVATTGLFTGQWTVALMGGLAALAGGSQMYYTGTVIGPEQQFYSAADKAIFPADQQIQSNTNTIPTQGLLLSN